MSIGNCVALLYKKSWRASAVFAFDHQRSQQFRRMQRADAGEMLHLLATRRSRRDQDRALGDRARRREQLAFADRARDVVMLARVAERSRHAATTGIEIDDGGGGNA